MSGLIEQLSAILGDAGLLSSDQERSDRARDTWSRSQIGVSLGADEVLPLAVAAPATTQEMADVVRACSKHGAPMIPRGGGSGVVGGVLASADSVVISTERMAGLRSFEPKNLLATFGAGTNGLVAEELMAAEGFTIGHWPQSIELSTVAGWVATRASGQYSSRYGNIEDMVYSLEAVLPDGSVFNSRSTPRAASGPDLRQLLIGSEGTLGIVTEVTLIVRPAPEPGTRQAFHFADFATGLEAVRNVMQPGWQPPVVRLYDGRESWRHFRDQLPKGRCMVIFLHEGPAGFAALEAAAVAEICTNLDGVAADSKVVDGWFEHRNTVPTWDELLAQGIVADTIEVATEWTRLAELYEAVVAAISAVPGVVAASGHSSHAYPSGANLYFTLAAAPSSREEYAATYDACWAAAMEAAAKLGAGLSHHHGIGRVRKDWLPTELGEGGMAMLHSVKRAIDPQNLMNPGVLLPEVE